MEKDNDIREFLYFIFTSLYPLFDFLFSLIRKEGKRKCYVTGMSTSQVPTSGRWQVVVVSIGERTCRCQSVTYRISQSLLLSDSVDNEETH